MTSLTEGRTAKNRMYIDIRVAREPSWDMAECEQLIRAKAAELATYGATTVREEESYDEHLDPHRHARYRRQRVLHCVIVESLKARCGALLTLIRVLGWTGVVISCEVDSIASAKTIGRHAGCVTG